MTESDTGAVRAILAARSEGLHRLPNVVGTGVGYRRRGGAKVDELCVRVYVERKLDKHDLRDDEVVPVELRVPGLGSCPTDVEETGRPQLLQLDQNTYRPVEGGCFIYAKETGRSGTLGGIAFDKTTLEPAWISNRHCVFVPSVFEPSGAVLVSQPGVQNKTWMGGTEIGRSEDVYPMAFGHFIDPVLPGYGEHPLNKVDAAKGDFSLVEPGEVSFSVIGDGPAIFELQQVWPDNPFHDAGTRVWKHGVATGTTAGHVAEIDVTIVDADYYPGFHASVGGPGCAFTIESEKDNDLFVDNGDSGSVVFAKEPGNSTTCPAVGLIFLQLGPMGVACTMPLVFELLGLETVCAGLFKKAVTQLVESRPYIRADGSPPGEQELARLRELRAFAGKQDAGRALIDLATAAIPEVATAIHQDPVMFGLYVRLLGQWPFHSTVLDLLETAIDQETIDLTHRLLSRVEAADRRSAEITALIGRAITEGQGKRLAELLRVKLD